MRDILGQMAIRKNRVNRPYFYSALDHCRNFYITELTIEPILDQYAFQVGSFKDLNVLNTKVHPCHPARLAVADKGFLGIIQLSFISA